MKKKKIKFANLYETKVKDKTIYEGYAIHEIDGKDVYEEISPEFAHQIKSAFDKPKKNK